MKVAYLHRKPFAGQVSIERVFRNVVAALPNEVDPVRFECPRPSKGIGSLLKNCGAAGSVDADVIHIVGDVHYLAMSTDRCRTVLTIHDLVSLRRLKGAKRSLFKALWYSIPARRAAVLTAISNKTRDDLVDEMPFLRGKVHVIPNPVDPIFRPLPKTRRSDVPVLVQIGTGANKNVERLMVAIRDLHCRLILVGKMSDEQRRLANEMAGEVISMQGVSDDELLCLYQQADLVTFVSTYEGFGLPIVEAQSIGRPVVTSNAEPMTGVAGGAALAVDPFDTDSIRDGIVRLLDNPSLSEQLVASGFANVKRFSAEKIASQYVALYDQIAGKETQYGRIAA